MLLFPITSGWTGVIGPFTLRLNGNPVDLTGLTVTLKLRRNAGEVTAGGTVTPNPDQTAHRGEVTYKPVASDFVLSSPKLPMETFHVHWQVVDGSGDAVFFPNGAPDEIQVYPA